MDKLELADKVEALDGPCRETDEAIFALIYPRGAFDMPLDFPVVPTHNQTVIPCYTASIDAAMTLVPTNIKPWEIVGLIDEAVFFALCPHDTVQSLVEKIPRFIVAAALRAQHGGGHE